VAIKMLVVSAMSIIHLKRYTKIIVLKQPISKCHLLKIIGSMMPVILFTCEKITGIVYDNERN